jgi:hypothetical protein
VRPGFEIQGLRLTYIQASVGQELLYHRRRGSVLKEELRSEQTLKDGWDFWQSFWVNSLRMKSKPWKSWRLVGCEKQILVWQECVHMYMSVCRFTFMYILLNLVTTILLFFLVPEGISVPFLCRCNCMPQLKDEVPAIHIPCWHLNMTDSVMETAWS